SNPRIAELLIAKGADVHAASKFDKFTPLHTAALRGTTAVARMLLAKGADVDGGWDGKKPNPSFPPLMFAAREGYVELARLLLGSAVLSGKKEIVELLLAKGADANATERGDTPALQFAANFGHTDIVALLLATGADPKQADDRGTTPLHVAANTKIAELLLAK